MQHVSTGCRALAIFEIHCPEERQHTGKLSTGKHKYDAERDHMQTCPTSFSHMTRIVQTSGSACNQRMSTSSKPLTTDPMLIFEAALTVVDSEDNRSRNAAVELLERVRPLRTRTQDSRIQKERALNDAAKALAKLWKKKAD
jgi:hypothetical protein